MTRLFAVATAALLAASATAHADMTSMAQGWTACNTQYQACVKGGTDMAMASTPAEGMAKMQSNMQNGMSCGQALQACYASVK